MAEHRDHNFICPCQHYGGQHGTRDSGATYPCLRCRCPDFDPHRARCDACGATSAEASPVPAGWCGARNIVGRIYYEHDRPVMVLTGWGPGGGPRNVRIRRADGTTTIRPFRGLRRSPRPRCR